MLRHWQPTAASYFGRMSKGLIFEALTEGGGKPVADKIDAMTRWYRRKVDLVQAQGR